jgi:type VI secretion system protein ImpM
VIGDPGPEAPGWYGKLPSLGDFASRRLQTVLRASRQSVGPGWLDAYLTMPIWRFVLLPGIIGPTGWAGVLMPSVDGVGRQFPLTLAVGLPSYTWVAQAVFDRAEWFGHLENAALATLDLNVGPEDLDRALADHAFAGAAPVESPVPPAAMRRLSAVDDVERLAKAEAVRAWGERDGWRALWWTRGRIDGEAMMLTSPALPTAEEFICLLSSRLRAFRSG